MLQPAFRTALNLTTLIRFLISAFSISTRPVLQPSSKCTFLFLGPSVPRSSHRCQFWYVGARANSTLCINHALRLRFQASSGAASSSQCWLVQSFIQPTHPANHSTHSTLLYYSTYLYSMEMGGERKRTRAKLVRATKTL